MNTDFRLSIDFWQHPKTKKLARRAGLEGVRSLQILWAWAACNRPSGSLTGMDNEDIELAADWNGEAGALVKALDELRWLDSTENGYALHDWQEHNPWAADAEARGDKARLSRLRQVNPAAYEQCVASGITAISQREYDELKKANGERQRIAGETPEDCQQNAGVAPAPSPSPSPVNLTPFNPPKGELAEPAASAPKDPYSAEFELFWHAYPKKAGKDAAFRAWKAKKREKRLPPVAELIAKVEQFKSSEQWQRDGGQYIPNPATWLNQGRWMDEAEVTPAHSPAYREPQPPEMLYPDTPPEISEETRAKIAQIKANLARQRVMA
jgi:hypothetical protein